ncbi:MAG TPA: ABC transporter ATP-binding protein, partial [Asanoa sp.]|nr:ABC transporter ATP-binding protein [Asanoa sp.]
HYMFEADELCDRIAVIAQGRIVALDTPHDLKQQVTTGTVLEIEVFGLPDGLVEKVRAEPDVLSVMVDVRGQAEVLTVHARPGSDVTQTVMRHLDGSRFGRVITREPTLEDAYIELVNAA